MQRPAYIEQCGGIKLNHSKTLIFGRRRSFVPIGGRQDALLSFRRRRLTAAGAQHLRIELADPDQGDS
jgi:hypothetical protein